MGSPAEDEEIRAPEDNGARGGPGHSGTAGGDAGFWRVSRTHARTQPARVGGRGDTRSQAPGRSGQRRWSRLEQGGPVPRAQGRDGKGL